MKAQVHRIRLLGYELGAKCKQAGGMIFLGTKRSD